MKTFMLLLLLSAGALAQTKDGDRYKIVQLHDIAGVPQVIMIDSETGKTWCLVSDTVYFASKENLFEVKSPTWRMIPFEKIDGYGFKTMNFTDHPEKSHEQ
ncbi:MAG TPA: hypothetical protein VMF88_12125 [Bacteroidota bacterium]|nr:hypothetical protein [Bacteroidota bacterium]